MEDKTLGIKFLQDDVEMFQLIREYYPTCQLVKVKEFEGVEIFWVAIIPAAAFSLQLLDFIFTHIKPVSKGNSGEESKKEIKRKMICNGESIDSEMFVDKSKEEVSHIIKVKFGIEFNIDIRTKKDE